MSGLSQLIGTAWTGLDAATQAMETVSNNTANVNTPGYNVESVQQVEVPGLPNGAGLGTDVTSIQRAFNQFVFSQMVSAGSANQAAQTVQNNAQGLAAIFPISSGGAGGLGAALTSFFAAMNAVSQDPASLPNRQTFLSDAQTLAADFNSVGAQLGAAQAGLNGQMSSAVSTVNSLTQQIATLNTQIMAQSAAGTGSSNAAMDSRDNLVQQLGQELGVTVVAGANGSVDIYTTGGAMLVASGTSVNLTAASGGYGAGALSIGYQPSGQDITASLSGGAIGGIITSQAQIAAAQNSAGGIAAALAASINTQQSLGLDLKGAQGGPLFTVGGPAVIAAAANTGTGTLAASITDTNAFVPGDFIVTKTGAGYQATNTATGQVNALGAGPTFSLDGMTLTVSGAVNTGDSFEVEPTAAAAQTLAVATTNPNAIAAAAAYVASPGSNTGNVTASAFTAAASGSLAAGTVIVPLANFGQNLTVKFTSATAFDVLSPANTVIGSGTFSAGSGAQIAIAYPSPPAPAGEVTAVSLSPGTPAVGDTFSLTPGGVSSNGNVLAMTNLASQNLLSGQTFSNAYATLVGQVGSAGQAANFAAQTAQGVLTQVQSVQQSISGVNLDQQAADLVNYQQAYQAAAQVIASAQTLFQSLLTAIQA